MRAAPVSFGYSVTHLRVPVALLLLLPALAHAAAAEPSPWFSLFKMLMALGVIIVAIVLVLGFMRRIMVAGLPGGQQPLLRLRGGLMVGQRERVIIVEVEQTWLVVGVTATQMTLLHTLPRGETPDAPAQTALAQHWLEVWRKVRPGGAA